MTPPRRGEIWDADLDPVKGREQGGARPVLILSESAFNASKAELVVVLPVTSKARALRTRVAIQPPEGGVAMSSYVICEQPRTISVARLLQQRGIVSAKTMQAVESVVRALLGL